MTDAGSALMGIGQSGGENRATEAAKQAIASPLLEESVEGATGILLNITGGRDIGLFEINEAAEVVQGAARPEREHHLRLGDRREHGRRDPRHGDRDGLRPRARAPAHRARGDPRPRPQPRPQPARRARPSLEISDDEIDIPPFLRDR